MKRAIHIFYKDLNFHFGLHDVAKTHQILPLFLWSEKLNQDVDATPSIGYRLTWARIFNRQLLPADVNLLVVAKVEEIVNLAILYKVELVTMLCHYEPREIAFQEALQRALAGVGVTLKLYALYTLLPPDSVLKQNGEPYRVFTPYYKKWRQQLKVINVDKTAIKWLPQTLVPKLNSADYSKALQVDLDSWQQFIDGGWKRYIKWRDFPAKDATSHLAALINHGILNVHDALKMLVELPYEDNVEAFIRQLAWRDFLIAILKFYPASAKQNFNRNIEIPWSNRAMDLQIWCEGHTGYPLVDAAMKDLYKSGRMHNRLRMIVAGFLTKDLLIDWREGARWFKEHLIDYDLALNVGGWQWAASTGVDAVPYFRVFNPTTQSEKYDPAGIYIKSQIAELCHAPIKKIHFPQKYGIPYTARCVEHATARKYFLAHTTLTKKS